MKKFDKIKKVFEIISIYLASAISVIFTNYVIEILWGILKDIRKINYKGINHRPIEKFMGKGRITVFPGNISIPKNDKILYYSWCISIRLIIPMVTIASIYIYLRESKHSEKRKAITVFTSVAIISILCTIITIGIYNVIDIKTI